jgi:integrase
MFTEFQGLTFPIKNIDYPLMVTLTNRLKDRGLAHASINRFISAVSVVLKFTKKMRLHDVALDWLPFERLREHEANRTYFTKEQVHGMINFARTQWKRDDVADIIQVAALTGMRQSEILNLPARWVNFDLNILALEKCKWGRARTIPIHPQLVPILKSRIEFAKPNVKIFGDEWTGDDQLRRAFYKCMHQVGCYEEDGYCFHSLRYSFATWHMASGTPPIDVQNMCGHKSISTTLGYAKSMSESQQKHTMKLEF